MNIGALNKFYKNLKKNNLFFFNLFKGMLYNDKLNLILHPNLDENSRWVKKSFGKNTGLRLIKYPVTSGTDSTILFKLRFNDLDSKLNYKVVPNTTYLTLKQKRYKRRKKISLFTKFYKNNENIKNKFFGKLFLRDNSTLIGGCFD